MNEIWILLLLMLTAALPVIFVFCWFRLRKSAFITPPEFLAALSAGVVSLIVAFLLQSFFPLLHRDGPFASFFNIFFRIAFLEELSRVIVLVPLFYFIKRKRSGLTARGGITAAECAALGLVAGLGFAMLESAFYGITDANITLLRAFTAAPVHGACGIRVGVAVFFFSSHPAKALFGFIFAVLIHGAYNMMIANPALPSALAILIAITALFSSLPLLKNDGGNSHHQPTA